MEDLVLTTRLNVLEKSIEQVEGAVTSIEDRRQDVRMLLKLLDKEDLDKNEGIIQSAASSLKRNVASIMPQLTYLKDNVKGDEQQEALEVAQRALSQAERQVELIQNGLKTAEKNILAVKMRLGEILEDTEPGRTLRVALKRETNKSRANLKDARNKLKKSKDKYKAHDQTGAEAAMREAWKKCAAATSQPLFAEYVDLLGGLTLRDTGFDEDICKMGDDLIEAWVPKIDEENWRSLTVPAPYRESPAATPARIIRLGFPEWTIWALPLAAHEFGHVVVKQSEMANALIVAGRPRKQIKSHREEYAADAIATYTMGPAYACAAILLRFDPTSAYTDHGDHPAHAKRAHVVFTMLEWLNREVGSGPYRDIINQLRKYWKDALDQAQSRARPEQKEYLKRLWGYLEGKDARVTMKKVDPELNSFLERLWKYMEDEDPAPIKYPPKNWEQIPKEWSKEFLKNSGKGIEIGGSTGLRDVLNAAWKCRIYDVTQTKELRMIGDAVRQIWKRPAEEKERAEREQTVSSGTGLPGVYSKVRG